MKNIPKPKHNHRSLKFKIFFIVAHSMIPMFLLMVYSYIRLNHIGFVETQNDVNFILETVSQTYRDKIRTTKAILKTISSLDHINPSEADLCNKEMAEIHAEFGNQYTSFNIVDKNGDVFCSSSPEGISVNVSDLDYYKKAVRKMEFAVGEFRVGRVTQRPIVPFVYPIVSDSTTSAVIITSLNLEWLQEVTTPYDFPESSVIDVIDRHGTVLSRYPETEAYFGTDQSQTELVKRVLSGGYAGNFVEKGFDGMERRFFYSKIQESSGDGDFYAIIGIPQNKLFKDLYEMMLVNVVFISLTLFITLVITYYDWIKFVKDDPFPLDQNHPSV